MPSINITENINGLSNNLQQIRKQTKEAEVESYRLEGMIRVFKNLHDVGVTEIALPDTKPLEGVTEEQVIDDETAVLAVGSE
jgi:hypothetical protein